MIDKGYLARHTSSGSIYVTERGLRYGALVPDKAGNYRPMFTKRIYKVFLSLYEE
jgi:hypothetical protein